MNPSLTYAPPRALAPWPWLLLPARLLLFAGFQGLLAVGFWLTAAAHPWEASAAWWPFTVTLANLVCLALLTARFRAEGGSFWRLFRLEGAVLREGGWRLLVLVLITGPIAFLPNLLLNMALFGDPQIGLNLMLRPLPLWAAWAAVVVFPLTQALAELATYFAYVRPRLELQGVPSAWALTLPAVMLGLQHMAVPLVFDGRYLLWRGLMFIPFAFLAGLMLRWKPRLLPYAALVHGLMDLSFAAMLFGVAY